ncbi:Putative zinc-or iron-chelating domain-containing protein [Verrucomicrobium sp. GAS474]|nr:Putative zinc-or iron-chelating domain-containing protein [Verrucomicrobium sp. GAS474]
MAAVGRLRASMSPAAFDELIGEAARLYRQYLDLLQSVAPGAPRGRLLHRLMDQEVAEAAHVPVSCRKGCAGCCHYEVEVTSDEGALLGEIVQRGYPIDRERLARLAARERRDPEWLKLAISENRCVFLGEDRACGIYENRPASCRKHLVTSPAALCTLVGESVIPVPLLSAEILMTAALNIEGTGCASLPKMVQAAMRDDEGKVEDR